MRRSAGRQATFYNWRKMYAGLMPSEMKRLRQLKNGASLTQWADQFAGDGPPETADAKQEAVKRACNPPVTAWPARCAGAKSTDMERNSGTIRIPALQRGADLVTADSECLPGSDQQKVEQAFRDRFSLIFKPCNGFDACHAPTFARNHGARVQRSGQPGPKIVNGQIDRFWWR